MQTLDQQIYYILNSLAGKMLWLDVVIVFIAKYLDLIVIILIAIFLIFHTDKGRYAYWSIHQVMQRTKEIITVATSSGMTWLIVTVLKAVFAEPRPFTYLEGAYVLFEYGMKDSFPSGHAALFAAVSTALFHYHRKAGIVMLGVTVLVGGARVIAGVHLPFDIIAGIILGGGVGYSTTALLSLMKQRLVNV